MLQKQKQQQSTHKLVIRIRLSRLNKHFLILKSIVRNDLAKNGFKAKLKRESSFYIVMILALREKIATQAYENNIDNS